MSPRLNGRTKPAPLPKPRRYAIHLRLVDRHHANRDAKAGLPALGESGVGGTPTPEFLGRGAAAGQQAEWILCLRETAEDRGRALVLRARVQEAERLAAEAEAAVAESAGPLSEEEQNRRRGGEHKTAEAVVRARRAREWSRRLADLRSAAEQAAGRAAALTVELHTVEARIAVRREAAAARAVYLHEQAMRRVMAYDRQLVRRHADGARINGEAKYGGPELPAWVAGHRPELG
ncbi:hypothetical protein ACIQCJ_07345 [Streptomyces sp. NPDC093221]|uniref:hypothetical protein n=1 Tax=Streptomyces sp. NPDC093221 TaxID=3366032 RepID=UPI00381F1296